MPHQRSANAGIDGIDLQARLISRGHRIPIIFITGDPEENTQARTMKAGAVGFMGKPYNVEPLVACLDKALKAPDLPRQFCPLARAASDSDQKALRTDS